MIESRYMEFDKVGDTGKTEIWNILSKSSGFILGQIRWYGAWRQYCFYPSPHCVFNTGCMDDIKKMIGELMKQRRITNQSSGREEVYCPECSKAGLSDMAIYHLPPVCSRR